MQLLSMIGCRLALRALATALLLTLLGVLGIAFAPSAAAQGGSGSDLTSIIVFQTVSGGPIYAVNADTLAGTGANDLRYLTTGVDPALSPDGEWVAFTRWDDTQHGALGSLWVINVDGSGERAVLGEMHQPKAPVWSPDGTQIVVGMQQGGRLQPEHKCSKNLPSEPLLADEDGDYIRVVVEIDGDDVEIRFCYTLLPHPFWGLRMVDVATGAFEDLPRDRFSYAPAWDPANAWRLVYDGDMGLVNLDLNEGTTWALTEDVHDHAPVFSPDGSKIAVSYWQHDHWEIPGLVTGWVADRLSDRSHRSVGDLGDACRWQRSAAAVPWGAAGRAGAPIQRCGRAGAVVAVRPDRSLPEDGLRQLVCSG
jgi:dipeptidyl aminopeptidase/acylaminoacyl peptidase